jgi:hypothetical protein
MKFLVNLGEDDSSWLRSSRTMGYVLKPFLEALTMANQVFLKLHSGVPLLYQAGVRYDNEPEDFLCHIDGKTERVEDFASIPTIIKRGWGDCDDLAPWRCAELRNMGEHAGIRIQWKTLQQRMSILALGQPFKLYHILVRRGDGTIEDPSKILGMP